MSIGTIDIDEEWLEKKMLCFIRRYNSDYGPYDMVTCGKSECPFCFAESKQKK